MITKRVSIDHQVDLYEIYLQGHLAGRWAKHFGDVSITLEKNGLTRLTCKVVDQAALFGLLNKVRDLGLPLLSVRCIDPEQSSVQTQTNTGAIK